MRLINQIHGSLGSLECGIGLVVVNESLHSRQRLYAEPYLFCEGWRPKCKRYLLLTMVLRLCRK